MRRSFYSNIAASLLDFVILAPFVVKCLFLLSLAALPRCFIGGLNQARGKFTHVTFHSPGASAAPGRV
jgi:hypothetical protein